nr:MAG TPA: hypothetical protein [Caudoviricetes sp.]
MSNFRIPTLNAAGEFTGSALAHIQKVASAAGGGGGSAAVRDTGWRRVESPNLASGYVFFRRVDNLVSVTVRGGNWDTATVKPGASRAPNGSQWGDLNYRARLAINILPGFRALTPVVASVMTDDGEPVGMLIMSNPTDGNRLSFRGFRNGQKQDVANTYLRFPILTWITSEDWPTELPGEPA